MARVEAHADAVSVLRGHVADDGRELPAGGEGRMINSRAVRSGNFYCIKLVLEVFQNVILVTLVMGYERVCALLSLLTRHCIAYN